MAELEEENPEEAEAADNAAQEKAESASGESDDSTQEENSEGASDDQEAGTDGVKVYDFAHPSHKLNSSLPVLELINERLAELLSMSLTTQFHQEIKVNVSAPTFEKFKGYAESLPACINIDQFKLEPLHGSALLIIEGDLAFKLVDSFFGGESSLEGDSDARRFTPTEERIIGHMRKNVFSSMSEAWNPVFKLNPEFQTELTSAQIKSPANPAAVVVVMRLEVELKAGKGLCHIVMPYSMLEPIKNELTQNIPKNIEHGARWQQEFKDRVLASDLDLRGVFAESQINIKQLVSMKVGDFIPLGNVRTAEFSAEGTPLFMASVGASNGMVSASVIEWHHRKNKK